MHDDTTCASGTASSHSYSERQLFYKAAAQGGFLKPWHIITSELPMMFALGLV